MNKPILHHHASTVLAKCGETGEFLFGQYDPGYPGKNKHWIGRVKLLGGNYFAGRDADSSPLYTLQREVGEEFSGKKAAEGEMAASQEHKFSSQSEIEFVRKALLSVEPYQDFFAQQFPAKEGDVMPYVIQSVFRSNLTKQVIECVKDNLSERKSLTNEGFLAVKTLDELTEGNLLCQGLTGMIIGNSEGTFLPYCFIDKLSFAPIGKPRESYSAYLDSFDFLDHSKK
jgi:hypothetical protein